MNRSTLKNCLILLASLKKNLKITELVEAAWYQALKELSDDQGKKAFSELMRSTTYGDSEPAHILEIAEKHAQMWVNSDNDEHPWISKAPKFIGEKFQDLDRGIPTSEYAKWREIEQHRRYRSTDQHDNIFLIQNPEAWDWMIKSNKIYFTRPDPEATGNRRTDGAKQKSRPAWNQR